MNSIAFSAATLSDDQAREIAAAYIKGDREPQKMARILGVDSFDLNLVVHPFVRGHIARMQSSLRENYSLSEHQEYLKKIRDAAFGDDNYKIALAAETQLGKSAGHYDPKPIGEDADDGTAPDISKLSTDDLRRRLAKMAGAVIPQDRGLPHPGDLPDEDEDVGEL